MVVDVFVTSMFKNKIIFSAFVAGVLTVLGSGAVLADEAECTPIYGGGETCLVNKRFEIDKEVRVKDSGDDWEDKVTGVKGDDLIEFKITVKNKSDDEADNFDNMKVTDFLPDELEKVGGAGLTEEWDDFEPGDSKSFIIEVQIKESEFDRDDNFEKCVVNKAEVEWDGEFEGSDTATVCFGDAEVTELPSTGGGLSIALSGLGMVLSGIVLKRKDNLG